MKTGAADLVLVDERDFQAELGGPKGRRVTAGTRAEHDKIEVIGRADGHQSGSLRIAADRRVPGPSGSRVGGWVIESMVRVAARSGK